LTLSSLDSHNSHSLLFLLSLFSQGVVYTWNILKMNGIEEADIPKFADATHWLHYFPPYGKTVRALLCLSLVCRSTLVRNQRYR
jgi:hypothetical protein